MVVTIKNLTANVVCMSKKAEVLSFKLLMQSGNRENNYNSQCILEEKCFVVWQHVTFWPWSLWHWRKCQ